MKIGEFAEVCSTKISVLRHYDKEGLLIPDYTDPITGYRYYKIEQAEVFQKIKSFIKAGFSLKEIRDMLPKLHDTEYLLKCIEKKKEELDNIQNYLSEVKYMLIEKEENKILFEVVNLGNSLEIRTKIPVNANEVCTIREFLENKIAQMDCQRISKFRTYGEKNDNKIKIGAEIQKLKAVKEILHEDTNMPFVNDERVIGKWKVEGEYAVKEDFFAEIPYIETDIGDSNKEIYFLPNGERYWVFGWTKDYMLCDTGRQSYRQHYEIEEYKGKRYMFVEYKSYYYSRGGKPTVLVLSQVDNKEYCANEIARKDNINIPFVNDEAVLGKWRAIGFCIYKEDFMTSLIKKEDLYFKCIEFLPEGECISVYGDEIIRGNDSQTWTKDYVLRKWNSTACKYEIFVRDNKEYLVMEWKSGDYRWGGKDTDYYVFERER